ncbi:MAG: lysophospholipid acyltransferase family protein, partial [Candidatus Kryptoniota bacterium]
MTLTDHLQSGFLKLFGAFLRRFSLRRVQKMAARLGRFFYRHVPVRRNVALANLKLCFPEKGDHELENILEESYVNVATVLFEFLYFPKFTKENLKKIVEFPDVSRQLFESALERGRGL